MNLNRRNFFQLATFLMMALVPSVGRSQDEGVGHQRTQEIPLVKGWNAVFLEVEPNNPAPQAVFGNLPVERVATLFSAPTTNQFVTDPEVNLFQGQGWGVWYAAKQPEAFLKSLDSIDGNRAYLIFTKSAFTWKVTGRVRMQRVEWKPDAYNLVGFSVRATGAPTFAEFFAGSKAHQGQVIYRMVDGRWKQVLQLGAETMKSGEAFWIKCKGSSDYQGPLRVETATSEGLQLGNGVGEVIIRNASPHPLTPVLKHVATDSSPLPLSVVVRMYGDPSAPVKQVAAKMPAAGWEQELPALEIGAAYTVPFEVRTGEMSRARQGSLLKITSDIGTETWVPLAGTRDDLGN